MLNGTLLKLNKQYIIFKKTQLHNIYSTIFTQYYVMFYSLAYKKKEKKNLEFTQEECTFIGNEPCSINSSNSIIYLSIHPSPGEMNININWP